MERRINKIIGFNLYRVRMMHRYSQRDIAMVLYIKQPSYNRMEAGTARISAAQLHMLADFYDIRVDDFYQETLSREGAARDPVRENNHLRELVRKYKLANSMLQTRNFELERKKGNGSK